MKSIMNMSMIDTGKLIIAEAYSGGYFLGLGMSGIRPIKGGAHAMYFT